MARIVLTTWGSLGDLHPYIAVVLGLRRRGHDVTLVTSEFYREKVESEGIRFHPSPPDFGEWTENREVFRKAHDTKWGTRYVIRELVMPYLRGAYEALLAASAAADLIVGHPVAYATPLVAEKLNKRWVQVALQPMYYLSMQDPPVMPPAPWLRSLWKLSPSLYRIMFRLGALQSRAWGQPVHDLREALGLKPTNQDPLMEGGHSPYANLSWFSAAFAQRQPDWPIGSEPLGFPFYDSLMPNASLPLGLQEFLDAGEPPVVFTLGSAAVMDAGNFYEESLAAVKRLGRRAVFLVGVQGLNQLRQPLPENIFVGDYAPYSALFPRASANVHQGGIGTTAQALRSGRPMVVVPFSHDQPDNAFRAQRLGVARVIKRPDYSASRIAAALDGIEALAPRASEIGAIIRAEDGVTRICEAIEAQACVGVSFQA